MDIEGNKLSYDWLQIDKIDEKDIITYNNGTEKQNVSSPDVIKLDVEEQNTNGPDAIKVEIEEHELSCRWLEVRKTENVKEEAKFDSSSTSVGFDSQYFEQTTVKVNGSWDEVGCDNGHREYNVTEVIKCVNSVKKEETVHEDVMINMDKCAQDGTANRENLKPGHVEMDIEEYKSSYEWLQIGNTEDEKGTNNGTEKRNIKKSDCIKMDVEHELSCKWLEVGKTENVEEEAKLDSPSTSIGFDDQFFELTIVKVNDSWDEAGCDNGQRKYDVTEVMKCVDSIKEEKTFHEDVIIDMEECAQDETANSENLKPINSEFSDAVRWYRCKFCGYKTKYEVTLKEHLKNKHKKGAQWYYCHLCEFKTTDKHYSKKHFQWKHDDGVEWYKCQRCEFETKNKQCLKSHFKYKHDVNPELYECYFCVFKTKYKDNLIKHYKNKHDQDTEWYHCQYCTFKTKYKRHLERHLESIHSIFSEEAKLHQCQCCDYRSKFKTILKQHLLSKHGQNLECQHCKFKTKNKFTLASHIKYKHDDNIKYKHDNIIWYKCKLCELKTKHKSYLKQHYKFKHDPNSEWHQCQHCEFKTKHKMSLRDHLGFKHDIIVEKGKFS